MIEKSKINYKKISNDYSIFYPAIINAIISLLSQYKIIKDLISGKLLEVKKVKRICNNYLEASLNFLVSQGLLDYNKNGYRGTIEGIKIFKRDKEIIRNVKQYKKIIQILEILLGWKKTIRGNVTPIYQIDSESDYDSFLAPAITLLHEKKFHKGKFSGMNGAEVFRSGEKINILELFEDINKLNNLFIQTLINKRLIIGLFPNYQATALGKNVFNLSGYAEVISSYYPLLQNLYPLVKDKLKYGFKKGVYRNLQLNARAAGSISRPRIIPTILKILNRMKEYNIFIDYASAGGEVIFYVAKGAIQINKCFGIEQSSKAISTAKSKVKNGGLSHLVNFVKGDILNKDSLYKIKEKIISSKLDKQRVITSMLFIMHEFEREEAEKILRFHSKAFSNTPVIVSEVFKIPLRVLKRYPYYRPASFQFLHELSNQNLFKEDELRNLIHKCGYRIKDEYVHSSIPSLNPKKRLKTVVTYLILPKKFSDKRA